MIKSVCFRGGCTSDQVNKLKYSELRDSVAKAVPEFGNLINENKDSINNSKLNDIVLSSNSEEAVNKNECKISSPLVSFVFKIFFSF